MLTMLNTRRSLVALAAALAAVTVLPACSVTRGQSTVGEYIDDTTITAKIRAAFVESERVDASSIKVETLDGEVLLSGFAKSEAEKTAAEMIARNTAGVRLVNNGLVVRS
ncbi:BON domain-containing protein [Hydrogenophaga sp. 5NK40-0174]|uniref:BON domain-containing protein n=1 Tax=Hydrogenophaga sp. 5NK40-0174 TaxID=3127649 RepID=UPI00310B6A89